MYAGAESPPLGGLLARQDENAVGTPNEPGRRPLEGARAGRDVSRANIGNELAEPFIDHVALAKAYGVFGVGPIENPNDLGPAIKRALEMVKRGEPALVDVITQGR